MGVVFLQSVMRLASSVRPGRGLGGNRTPLSYCRQPRGVSPFLLSVILFLWLGSSVQTNPREVADMIALLEKTLTAT